MKTTLPLLPQLSTHILCAHIHFWDYFCLPDLPGLGSAFVIGLLKFIQGKQAQIEELIAWPFGKNGNDSMMVTSYLINHNSRVGKTHWTMSFGQTILCRCLSNLFRQIFCGRRFNCTWVLCWHGALQSLSGSAVSLYAAKSLFFVFCVLRYPILAFPSQSIWNAVDDFLGKFASFVFLIYILVYFHLIFVIKAVLFSACGESLG